MGRIGETKARLFNELEKHGFQVSLDKRISLGPNRGYQVVTLDVVIEDQNGPIVAFYIGPDKQRKLIKYRMTKIKFFKVPDTLTLRDSLVYFWEWYTDKYLS